MLLRQHQTFELPFDKAEEPRCLWPHHTWRGEDAREPVTEMRVGGSVLG